MFTVLRLFVIDSMALVGIDKLEGVKPDFIEVLPCGRNPGDMNGPPLLYSIA